MTLSKDKLVTRLQDQLGLSQQDSRPDPGFGSQATVNLIKKISWLGGWQEAGKKRMPRYDLT